MSDLYRPRDDEAGPLEGVSVLDLTIARAGPTCVRQLSDMGAEVIQVASPKQGLLQDQNSDSHNLQRSKRSIGIDLKTQRGLEIFRRLAKRSDVLVENFRADVKKRLGIDYETLRHDNPRLIYASISGFGQDGPYAARPGLDPIAQGMGGLMSVTGPPGSGPWRAGIAVSDTASGTFLAQGIIAALYARERTGRGQWVHTSLLESMINFMDFQATRWLIDGEVPQQAGNDHPTIFPMGTFKTRDGAVNIAAVMGWERFLEAIDGSDLDGDPRFKDRESREHNRAALRAEVEKKLAAKTSAEWVEILNAVHIPCGPILKIDEVFADPQVQHLELTRRVRHERDGDLDLLRLPLTFSETPAGVRSAAPLPSAHSLEILRELGYEDAAIADLTADGVVSTQTRSGKPGAS